jgi:acetyl-CoA carboxylase biotin carboxylase subunit
MLKIKKILIANRGEIALRIIRTCKEMGIKTVALCHKEGEENNFLETSLADEYYYLNKEGASGYLDKKRILEIAKEARVDAIHPGYGFLAENWKFAKLCKKNGIKFIGPHFKILKKLEDKITAKKIAQKIGIPTLEASEGSIKTKDDLFKWVFKIRPPFVLKARRGGGGIGIRVVNGNVSFGEIFNLALGIRKQMAKAFSDLEFFLEKYIPEAHHIEFQILSDGKNFVHLGERECSIQRRFQKLFEETPSPFLDQEKREEMAKMAIKFLKELKYNSIGTVEFLVDQNKNFYFLEVNPRIQVEHPITEAVTGIDLVEQQIRIAQGEALSFSQEDVIFNGWGVEARINAEDPFKDFQPCPGKIEKYHAPGGQGIFIHTFLKDGQEIYPYFDSLLAKLIAWGKTRQEALLRLKRALDELVIEGVPTTIPFFKLLLEDKEFLAGNYNTQFIEKSGILKRVSPFKKEVQPLVKREEKLKEEEIAELVYKFYQLFKESKEVSEEKEEVSKWLMAERLKMFE